MSNALPIMTLLRNRGEIPVSERTAIQKFEKEVGFLNSKNLEGTFYRVSKFISDDECKAAIKKLLPEEIAKGVPTILGTTGGCAVFGGTVGTVFLGPVIGIPVGATVGGIVGLGLGIHLVKEMVEVDLMENFAEWKKEHGRKLLLDELIRIFKDDAQLADCICPVSLEIFSSPQMLLPCAHTLDAQSIVQTIKATNRALCCPMCRTKVDDIKTDLVKLLHLKKVFSELGCAHSTNLNYKPEIRAAFLALSKDFDRQVINHFTKANANLLNLVNEGKMTMQTCIRKQQELNACFKEYI